MEEIDIIELLKRVKEGKAPKEIEINGNEYELTYEENNIRFLYQNNYNTMYAENITFDTKIKILDKPIIEELKPVNYNNIVTYPDRDILTKKINEIIKWINKENKDE